MLSSNHFTARSIHGHHQNTLARVPRKHEAVPTCCRYFYTAGYQDDVPVPFVRRIPNDTKQVTASALMIYVKFVRNLLYT